MFSKEEWIQNFSIKPGRKDSGRKRIWKVKPRESERSCIIFCELWTKSSGLCDQTYRMTRRVLVLSTATNTHFDGTLTGMIWTLTSFVLSFLVCSQYTTLSHAIYPSNFTFTSVFLKCMHLSTANLGNVAIITYFSYPSIICLHLQEQKFSIFFPIYLIFISVHTEYKYRNYKIVCWVCFSDPKIAFLVLLSETTKERNIII